MANGDRSMTQAPGGMVRMAQHRSIGTHAHALVWRVGLAAVLTLLLLAPWRTPTAALHASAAGAGTSAAAQHLYWTNDGGVTIGRAWLDGSQVNNKFVVGGVDPERLCGVAIAGKYLYWGIDVAGTTNPAIGRAKLDGTGVNKAFIDTVDGPVCGIAADRRYIYWASYANGDIARANLDGTGTNQQFIGGLTGVADPGKAPCSVCVPDGVAVDRTHIYWGALGNLGRANLDGTGVQQKFITGLDFVSGVAVSGKYIYWTDSGGSGPGWGAPGRPSEIGRARLDGSAVQRGFIKNLDGACGLAITDRYIFWAQAGLVVGKGTAIGRANLDGTGVRPHFISGLQSPCFVAVGP